MKYQNPDWFWGFLWIRYPMTFKTIERVSPETTVKQFFACWIYCCSLGYLAGSETGVASYSASVVLAAFLLRRKRMDRQLKQKIFLTLPFFFSEYFFNLFVSPIQWKYSKTI